MVHRQVKRKSNVRLIILLAVLVLLIGGGTATYFPLIAPRLAGTTASSSPYATSTSFSALPTPTPTPTSIGTQDLIPYPKGDEWGYSDWDKTIVIPLRYDGAWAFSEGLALVKLYVKYRFIDRFGKIVINPQLMAPGTSPRGWLEWEWEISGVTSTRLAAISGSLRINQ